MTVADVIRRMDDQSLARFLSSLLEERDKVIMESLAEQGLSVSLVSMPDLSYAHNLNFVKQPAETVFHFEEENNA